MSTYFICLTGSHRVKGSRISKTTPFHHRLIMVTHSHCSLFLEFTKRANELSSFSHPPRSPLPGETGSNLPKHSGDPAASSPSSWMDSVSSLSPRKSSPRYRSPPLSKLHFHVIWIHLMCFWFTIFSAANRRLPHIACSLGTDQEDDLSSGECFFRR